MASIKWQCWTGSVLISLVLIDCQRGNEQAAQGGGGAKAAPLVRVTPIRPVRKTLIRRTEQPGEIEAFEVTPLYSKVTGYVARIEADIGDAVSGPKLNSEGEVVAPGQLIAELTVPELQEEHAQKQAIVGQTQAEVEQAAAAVRVAEAAQVSAQAKVEEAQAAKERAQADYDQHHSKFVRMEALGKKGAVTTEVVEEEQYLLHAADAARNEVAAKIQSAKAAVVESKALLDKSQADYKAVRAKLRVAQAEERRVAALLGYTQIRAPFDGVVSVRNIHTGHLVHPGTGSGAKPLFIVLRTDKVRIFVDVPQDDAMRVQNGNDVTIRIPSMSAESYSAKVTRSSWMLDVGARTLKTEIDMENPDGRLRPGVFVNADIKVAERPNALALPHTALWAADGKTYCFTIDTEGKVVRKPVVAGIRAGDEIEIVSGLSGDEQVIGANPSAFREGQQIEVVVPQTGVR